MWELSDLAQYGVSILSSIAAISISAHIAIVTRTERSVDALARQWWEQPETRKRLHCFSADYLPQVKDRGRPRTMATVPDEVRELAFYFDRIGWMSAQKLLKPKYILGPMLHTLNQVWLIVSDAVREKRAHGDAVYMMGLEWLYEFSHQKGFEHADIVKQVFAPGNPPIDRPTLEALEGIDVRLRDDEQEFRQLIGLDPRQTE
jgi:hypothetical protein